MVGENGICDSQVKVENDKVFLILKFGKDENCETLTVPMTCDRLTPEEAAKDPRQQLKLKSGIDNLNKNNFVTEFTYFKDRGNAEFKKGQDQNKIQAITEYSLGIAEFQRVMDVCLKHEDIMKVVTQLYTNRALTCFQIGNIESCLKDVNFVLTEIDSQNFKALYRRAMCYKQQSELSKAVEDLNSCH